MQGSARPGASLGTSLLLSAAFAALMVTISLAVSGDTTADRELGQPDFSHNSPDIIGARTLFGPDAVAIYTISNPNRLFVADSLNNRVLGWKNTSGFTNSYPADWVVGQPDAFSSDCNRGGGTAGPDTLCNPTGAAVDPADNLFVADQDNNRVLVYAPPFSSNPRADLVLGQSHNLMASSCNQGGRASADSLCRPAGVAVDGIGNVYVADRGNNRVLEYNKLLVGGNTTAALVIGQSDTSSTLCNRAGTANASTLCGPKGVAVHKGGDLCGNSRILEYNTPLTGGNTIADLVLGQANFNSELCNRGAAASGATLCASNGVSVDDMEDVYVSDTGNNRVLEYASPFVTHDTTAHLVFGQGVSFSTRACNWGNFPAPGANTLCFPRGVALDRNGNLFVADSSNNRVLEYDMPLVAAMPAAAKATPTAILPEQADVAQLVQAVWVVVSVAPGTTRTGPEGSSEREHNRGPIFDVGFGTPEAERGGIHEG